eukprot:EG_transcript_18060
MKRQLKRGEWNCPKCQALNFQHRALCHACKEEREDIKKFQKNGDWICNCGVMNFKSRSACRMCSVPNATAKSDVELPKGDWACKCGERNFRKRASCRRCKEMNPQLDDALESGDWVCPSCSVINFATKFQCVECKQFRPADLSPQQKSLPGDWICPQCHRLNFSARFTCISCFAGKAAGTAADAQETAVGNVPAAVARGEIWECCACGESNDSQMVKCHNCRMPRQFGFHVGGNQLLLYSCPAALEGEIIKHYGALSKPGVNAIVDIKWISPKKDGQPDAEITFATPHVCQQAAQLSFPDGFAPDGRPFTKLKATKADLQGKRNPEGKPSKLKRAREREGPGEENKLNEEGRP